MADSSRDFPRWLEGELRSDHAGETGAVWIYKGVLAARPKQPLRQFCERHLQTEEAHLSKMKALLPPRAHSTLLPVWRIAGFLTGFLPACFGQNAVYQTITAVESFVQTHYEQQIAHPALISAPDIRATLEACLRDEIHHKDEAASLAGPSKNLVTDAWCWLVGAGSKCAVHLARRL
ncbi:MAG: demethoxyubiquinone hydroxylase family protein [Gammaproteobacteria bacterium]|nr:demethoxyubiquinone hydroxylase family protein [Gammaproteobacteria bacterium]